MSVPIPALLPRPCTLQSPVYRLRVSLSEQAQIILVCKQTSTSSWGPAEKMEARCLSLCDLGKPLSLAVPVIPPPPHMANTTCSSLPPKTVTRMKQPAPLSCPQVPREVCTTPCKYKEESFLKVHSP